MYPKKAPNRARIYVRFRAHVTVFCPGDGESRSAFDGPKTLIARRCQRDSAYGPCNRKMAHHGKLGDTKSKTEFKN